MTDFERNKARVTAEYEALINRKNIVSDSYNGIYDRYVYPVLTASHAPIIWKYDMNPETNPYFMERLGINAVLNSGAIYLNGKYYLVARVEGNDRKSFFAVAESDSPVDGFRFWDFPVQLPDTEPEETNVYDMRLTQHEDGWIYGVFCSESKDKTSNDLSAATAQAGIVRTKDLKTWERLPNLKSKSPQQRNVVLHPEFVDGKYAFYTRSTGRFYRNWLRRRSMLRSLRRHHKPCYLHRRSCYLTKAVSHNHRSKERCRRSAYQDTKGLDNTLYMA